MLHNSLLRVLTLLSTIALYSACTPTTEVPRDEGSAQAQSPSKVQFELATEPMLIAATHQPVRRSTLFPGGVVYTLPTMSDTLLASELEYSPGLRVDLYYPPGFRFTSPLPIVILSHGFKEETEAHKDLPSHIDWAKLIAASGMIAASAQAGSEPVGNAFRLLEYISRNANRLGVDFDRVGFWSVSSQGEPTFRILEATSSPHRRAFRAAALLYSDLELAHPTQWPEHLALFVVKAGLDKGVSGTAMDQFVAQAQVRGMRTEYLVLPDARHAFDVRQSTQFSRDAVRQTLAFLKANLVR